MAHIFDAISTVNGQLNILNKYYIGDSNRVRDLPNTPMFLCTSLNRAVCTIDQAADDSSDEQITIERTLLCDTGDIFNPVYLCVVKNILIPILDKIPITINRGDISGPGVAYAIFIPRSLFNDDIDVTEAAAILRDVYFGLLYFDHNMDLKPDSDVIKYAGSNRIRIKSYDLEMTVVAICAANINLRSWFGTNSNPIGGDIIVDAIGGELPEDVRAKLISAVETYGTTIGNLRDSIGNGELLSALWENAE